MLSDKNDNPVSLDALKILYSGHILANDRAIFVESRNWKPSSMDQLWSVHELHIYVATNFLEFFDTLICSVCSSEGWYKQMGWPAWGRILRSLSGCIRSEFVQLISRDVKTGARQAVRPEKESREWDEEKVCKRLYKWNFKNQLRNINCSSYGDSYCGGEIV